MQGDIPNRLLCFVLLSMALTVSVLAQPEIGVEVASRNEWCSPPETMTDGGAYNSHLVKKVETFIITISNTGSSDLNLTTPLILTGPNTDIFQWTQQPSAVVTPGSNTEAKFRVNSSTKGWKTANLSMVNDDADENPFDIVLNILIGENHLIGQGFPDTYIFGEGFIYNWPVDVIVGEASEIMIHIDNWDSDGPSCSCGSVRFIDNPYISINGSSAFTITQQPDIEFTYSTEYKVKFKPTVGGVQKADISFRYNAQGAMVFFPFNFTIQAEPLCPDIIVRDIFVIDGEGPDITCKIRVKNKGKAATSQKFKNEIYLSADNQITTSDYLINDWNVLPPFDVDQFATSWDLKTIVTGVPPGEYYLGVIADAKSVIPESNEFNNTAYNDLIKIMIPEDTSYTNTPILEVPFAASPPVIDGISDPVWYSVCSVPMERPSRDAGMNSPDNWLDCFANFKMMVDGVNCYMFIEAYDEILNTSALDSRFNDSFELYFAMAKGGNTQLSDYDPNVLLLRYVYGDTTESTGILPNSVCRFLDKENGYHLEIRIPAGDILAALNPGDQFGFDICMNDNDGAGREHALTWSSASTDVTVHPDLLGTARIIDYSAENPMRILQAPSVPVIDGSVEEPAWEGIPWISGNTFVKHAGGQPLALPFDIQSVDDWNDCRFRYKLMWIEEGLCFFGDVYDDCLETGESDDQMNDGFQIFIDGNNDKNSSLDANDHEYVFVPEEISSDNLKFASSGHGWTVEALMDLNADAGIAMIPGHLIGLEIQLNDNDGTGCNLRSRWWSTDYNSKDNPFMYGTIKLDGIVMDAGEAQTAIGIKSFHLSQNYPNPFNPSTAIQFSVPETGLVRLTICNLLGREVAVLMNKILVAGDYSVVWEAKDHAAGIYLCQLRAGDFRMTRKLVLQK